MQKWREMSVQKDSNSNQHENCYPLVIVFVLKLLITLKPDKNLLFASSRMHILCDVVDIENMKKKKSIRRGDLNKYAICGTIQTPCERKQAKKKIILIFKTNLLPGFLVSSWKLTTKFKARLSKATGRWLGCSTSFHSFSYSIESQRIKMRQ